VKASTGKLLSRAEIDGSTGVGDPVDGVLVRIVVQRRAMQFVRANGIRFAYLEQGQGPLVLLIHGFPDTAHTWDHVMPQIAAKGYRVVAPFTRGYHPTEVPSTDPDARTLCDDIVGLIDALGGGEPAIVVAHDWGASAAYTTAALAPEKLKKLITVALPHPFAVRPSLSMLWKVRHFLAFKLPFAPKLFATNDFAALPALFARWSPKWNPSPSEFDAIRTCFSQPQSMNAAFGYYRKLAFRPPDYMKRKLQVDTVTFAGTDDPILTPTDYHRAARWFAKTYIVEEMPGGHFLHREHPERFAELLLRHL
jgi:pimeloyl-ACP methyl ester carboxylesterase